MKFNSGSPPYLYVHTSLEELGLSPDELFTIIIDCKAIDSSMIVLLGYPIISQAAYFTEISRVFSQPDAFLFYCWKPYENDFYYLKG